MKGLLALLIALLPAAVGGQAVQERVQDAVEVTGVVFLDRNGNGVADAGEPGIEGVAVSDQVQVVTTDRDGRYSLSARGYGLVFVSQPDGYVSVGPFWRQAEAAGTDFGLRAQETSSTFTFVHASDTHVSEASVDRLRRMREMVESLQPDFVLITGDLVRDALRVPEEEARGYYELLARELEFGAFAIAWTRNRPFTGYTSRPAAATPESGEAFAASIVSEYSGLVPAVLSGKLESPGPLMQWLPTLSLQGRLVVAHLLAARDLIAIPAL
jgi:hypothetical protein